VPPLRERREDVPFLADEFMRRFGRKHGVPVRGFSDASLKVLSEHNWPGNVRELQNVIERAVILSNESGLIEPEHLGMARQSSPHIEPVALSPLVNAEASSPAVDEAMAPLAEIEKRHILSTLDRCKGNRTQAAKALGVSIRTLRNKLHEYNGTQSAADADEGELAEQND
jgi:two-component system, response regulator FlrC